MFMYECVYVPATDLDDLFKKKTLIMVIVNIDNSNMFYKTN